jgi:hypothetical protein
MMKPKVARSIFKNVRASPSILWLDILTYARPLVLSRCQWKLDEAEPLLEA